MADRLLSLHISELHDNYFAVASKKKPLYCCLVEKCEQLFWSDSDRRKHLIDQHLFHVSYDFHNPKKFLKKYTQCHNKPSHSIVPGVNANTGQSSNVGRHLLQPTLNRAQRRAVKLCPETYSLNNRIAATNTLNTSDNMEGGDCTAPMDDVMDVDSGLEHITEGLRMTKLHVPLKISFGRRKGHH